MPEIGAIMTLCMNREAISRIPQVQYFHAGRGFWQAKPPNLSHFTQLCVSGISLTNHAGTDI
jgi:hypothetical protein